jgi:hypothetical protein
MPFRSHPMPWLPRSRITERKRLALQRTREIPGSCDTHSAPITGRDPGRCKWLPLPVYEMRCENLRTLYERFKNPEDRNAFFRDGIVKNPFIR